ncbi:MAG TPA: c-type cytochrome biogenesis protein CcmI [Alphaproteobacteria bacterium]|nr:c-type cytochrome biogenesis protein CcmI [Alphaproteobacteria bacterium]
MILALILLALTLTALGILVLPLFRHRNGPVRRAEYDIAVYKDQLREVERDLARGTIDAAAAHSARIEIERRLLAADNDKSDAASAAMPRAAAWRWTAVLALILLPAAALIYLDRGTPGLPQITFAERSAESAARQAEVDGLIGQVEQRLAENPEDLRGWVLLARAYARLGRIEDAIKAQAKATDLFDQEPDMAEEAAEATAAFGDLLVQNANGAMTPEARAAFGKALTYDPRNARARYFLAFAKMQDGDPKAAVADWKALIAETEQSGGEMPAWLASLKQRIAEIEASLGR